MERPTNLMDGTSEAQPMAAQFGVSLSTRAVLFNWGTLPDLIRAAKIAEDSGYFDGVWVGDNLLSKPRVEAIVTLSAIAAHTHRVKLGTICLASFTMRHPILLAIQWASLDQLSEGRTILAVCNGAPARYGPEITREYEAMGVRSEERVGRVIEGIKILRQLWSEELVTHQGKYYSFSDVEALPKPAQNQVPILIAANPRPGQADYEAVEDRILRRIGKHADGWQVDATPVDTFRNRFDRIRDYAAKQGRDPSNFQSCLHLMVNINEDRDQAFQQAQQFLAQYYGAGYITRERAEQWLAYGSPEAVIEKIQAYIDAGCTTPVLRFVGPDLEGQLNRCIQEVLPAFRTG